MNLPDLDLQWIYSRLTWGVVLAALLLRAWPRSTARMPRSAIGLGTAVCAAMWLPQGASPAYWLGLAFQYPSSMLVACCAFSLAARQGVVRGGPMREGWFSLVVALGGALLYADSSGWLNLGLYARGFDPLLGPTAALALGSWAVWWIRRHVGRDVGRGVGLVVLASVIVFCLTRLPSGNVFDAFLDPLLWAWALAATLAKAARRWRRTAQPQSAA